MRKKRRNHMKKWLAFLLCFCMTVSAAASLSFADGTSADQTLNGGQTVSADKGLCEHHQQHDETCGYQAARAGAPCNHQHDESCGYAEGVENSCTHQHDEGCGYIEKTEGSPCAYVCEICKDDDDPDGEPPVNQPSVLPEEPGLPNGGTGDDDQTGTQFDAGRSVTYYAPSNKNDTFGGILDYYDDKALNKWNEKFTDPSTVYYSEKKIAGEDSQSYCAFQFKTEEIDWGSGKVSTYCLTKTYNKAVPDEEIKADGWNDGIVLPFNGITSGGGLAGKLGPRMVAYNTAPSPGENSTWYRCGQRIPSGVTELYVQFKSALQLASEVSSLAKDASAGIRMNGETGVYTAENPYIIPVTGGKPAEDALYYTAWLDMGQTASLMSWARRDKMDLGIDETYVELTINFDSRLDLFSESGDFTFQYTGGFVPYRNGDFMTPDSGTVCTYTITVTEDEMPGNKLTLKFGLNDAFCENDILTLDQFAQMSLTVSGQRGAKAVITEELAKNAADGPKDETDPSFIKTDGSVKICVTPEGSSQRTETIPIAPVYAQLRQSTPLTLTAQDMTAYTGGDSISDDPFPSVRYAIEGAEEEEIESLVFRAGDETFSPEKSGSCWILSGLENSFTPEDSMEAAAHDSAAGTYEIGTAAEPGLTVTDENGEKIYTPSFAGGTLTVRSVSDPGAVLNETTDIAQPAVNDESQADTSGGLAAAVIDADAAYYTNGSTALGVLGTGAAGPQISLLFDDILSRDAVAGADTIRLLREHAREKGFTLPEDSSELKYLDLINENDGNAWVSTDKDITIFWPYPDEVKADPQSYDFSILHFEGLHREYQINSEDDMENLINTSTVTEVKAQSSDKGVKFTLKGNAASGSFSPFALAWEKKGSVNPGPGPDPQPAAGSLSVSKTVTGAGDKTQSFTFTVALNSSLSGVYGDMTFQNGKAVFALKHGETKTASGLPAGTVYTVTESDNQGYEVSAEGETGTIVRNTVTAVKFVNHKEDGTEPGQPEDPDDPADPDDPVKPGQPGDADDPEKPGDSNKPADSNQPAGVNPGAGDRNPSDGAGAGTSSPQTGDTSSLGLWVSLLTFAGVDLAVIALWNWRKKLHKKA